MKQEFQTELDKLAAEEQKRNEKRHRKMKWRNKILGLFGCKIERKEFPDVEIPAETCELTEEYFELKEKAEEAIKGK